ncbi:Global transcription regulator sge1 [Fusarium torreyae]|uniref:Global transcription regulator sge1 n=1 Tax=Fusarium torreyae TaxID=1237075 RepID=A0A9W8S0T0_9HYPO|nr:Global transcription regulator sge1 [Fusarium torreyae]
MASSPLQPTLNGFVRTTLDALILFEACLSGRINHVPRRPHDRERTELIQSGNIFIYEEHASGIKRWTDSVTWSPSRILGNFLIYRELDKPFPPGEKKRALKKTKKPNGGITKPEQHRASISLPVGLEANGDTTVNEEDRAYVGSLVDSYPFKANGLVKKTISITYQGVPHHLVSYYNVEDAKSGRLVTPSNHPQLRSVVPRGELVTAQNFRAPLDEADGFSTPVDQRMGYYQAPIPEQDYSLHAGAYRTMSMPNVHSFPRMSVPNNGFPNYHQQFSATPQYVPPTHYFPQQPQQPQQQQHPQHPQQQQQQPQQQQHQQQQEYEWAYGSTYFPSNGGNI